MYKRQVLDHIRRVAQLTPVQVDHWDAFKEMWDAKMAAAYGGKWAPLFVEVAQAILTDFLNGKDDALSIWMENERKRILQTEPILSLPALTYK